MNVKGQTKKHLVDKIEYLYDLDVRHDSLNKIKEVAIIKYW